jgi:outer membrane protein OmpA-like peptidoglycan-associated protein
VTAKTQLNAIPPPAASVPGLWRCGSGACGPAHTDHDDDQVRRHSSGAGPGVAPSIVRRVLSSPGSSLPSAVRQDAETALGHDFSQVRVHTDDLAAESARAVSAHAYTVGNHVVFGRGSFAPVSSSGRRLLFHELVHTTQSGAGQQGTTGGVARAAIPVSDPDDPAEVAAERIAARAVASPVGAEPARPSGTGPVLARCGPIACPPGTCDHEDEGFRVPQGMVMRQAVLEEAPNDLPCELTTAPGHSPGTDITFGHESSVLTPASRAAIAAFVQAWTDSGSSDDVVVDGWASTDGPQALNWRLSCERAAVVRAELAARGIPATKLRTVAHGESTEFSATELAPNRRVVISRVPVPTPPTPPPGPPTPAPPTPAPAETITSETVATRPGARTRRTVGVGEQVRLTHDPGSATWTKTDGTLSATTGVTVTWTAPDTRKHAAVRAGGAWIDFEVIAPTRVHMDRFAGTGVKHTQNRPDSGIEVQPFLLPDNVNFHNLQYRELNVAAVATGVYACFAANTGHCAQPAGGACPPLTMRDVVVAGKGTQATLADCVYSGDCLTAAPFAASRIIFDMGYEYRVGGGPFRRFTTVHQESNVAADGVTLTSIKVGARGTTTVPAATVAIPDCP